MNATVLDKETLHFGRLLHYAGLAVLLILGAIAFSHLYAPIEQDIFDVEVKIDELNQSRKNAATIQQKHARLSERLQGIATRYATLQQRVPDNAEAGSFLKHVSDIARDEDLTIYNFQPGRSVRCDGYIEMEVVLEGRGSFAGICAFFDRLSKIQRLSKVEDITISVSRQTDKYPMKATLIIYFGLQSDREQSARKESARG